MLYNHISVMPNEAIQNLNCRPGKIYVDCTLGGAGHAKAIIEKISPDGVLIGIDQDMDAIENGKKVLKMYESSVRLFHNNFVALPEILSHLNIKTVDGILLDLGVSFHQISESGRGFSFKGDEPLDMRMNPESGVPAEHLVNTLKEKELIDIFFKYGEERSARQIARGIVGARKIKPIKTSGSLVEIILKSLPPKVVYNRKIHPATKVFMALRIAVNKELERLESFLEQAADYLNPNGRLCVLSFHSLEDRIVKQWMKKMETDCVCPRDFPKCVCNERKIIRILTGKVLRPTEEEILSNPMARSTKLRVAEKI